MSNGGENYMSKKEKPVKIAVTGPESTGKSTLAQQLADHYQTVWVPEFARTYLLRLDRPYNYDDILTIARSQKRSEEAMLPLANHLLFTDTELLVTKIWCEVKFGKCHPWIREQVSLRDYDLYLLTDIDLPWEYDPLREDKNTREFLFDRYKSELQKLGVNFKIVKGSGKERLNCAIKIIEKEIFGVLNQ
jgi:NadR type nicotinamide-nucleotide adenylyltransferase